MSITQNVEGTVPANVLYNFRNKSGDAYEVQDACITVISGYLDDHDWREMGLTCKSFHTVIKTEAAAREKLLYQAGGYLKDFPFIKQVFGFVRRFQKNVPEIAITSFLERTAAMEFPEPEIPQDLEDDPEFLAIIQNQLPIEDRRTREGLVNGRIARDLRDYAHAQMKERNYSIAWAQNNTNCLFIFLRLKDLTPSIAAKDPTFETWIFHKLRDGSTISSRYVAEYVREPSFWARQRLTALGLREGYAWDRRGEVGYRGSLSGNLIPNYAYYLGRLVRNENCGLVDAFSGAGQVEGPLTTVVNRINVSTISLFRG